MPRGGLPSAAGTAASRPFQVLHQNPINFMTVQKALSMMAADVATAMDFSDEGYFVPVRWNDWLELPVREQEG